MKIGVMGAGAIGCYLGGMLVAQGVDVTFVGRARGKAEIDAHGMVLETLGKPAIALPASKIHYVIDATALSACDVVLCAVKSAQSKEAASALAGVLTEKAIVVSMQNGLHNADVLRAGLASHRVLGGIVGFNVVAQGSGVFRRATTGLLAVEWTSDGRIAALANSFERAGLATEVTKDIRGMQWTKLVMNLSNALGALSGVPTREVIFDTAYRKIMRAVVGEATRVMRAAKIAPARMGPLPIFALPTVLALPTPLLRVVAGAQVKVDPEARSSMWQDLSKGRSTEVDELNGEIVRLAASLGVAAPFNQRLVELVHDAESAQNGSPNLSAHDLWSKLTN